MTRPDEQEIEIKLDEPVAPTEIVIEPDKSEAEAKPDPAFTELKRQHDELVAKDAERARAMEVQRRETQAARQQAERATQDADLARSQATSTELERTNDAIVAAQAAIDSAKRDYRTAQDAGDYDKAAEAQERIATEAARKVAMERDKVAIEARKPPQREVQQQERQPADPFEAALSRFTPTAQAWLREHPDVLTDPEQSAKATWVDIAARKAGHKPDTPEYFRYAEEQLGYTNGQQAEQKPATQTRRPMPSAPPSRDNDSSPIPQSTKVFLSEAELKAATDGTLIYNIGPNKGKPLGVKESARRKAILQSEGKYKNIGVNG